MANEKSKSRLTRLTMKDLNAAISRGVELRQNQVPSALKTKTKMFTASSEKTRQDVKQRREQALKELADYKQSMQFARRALRNLGKNSSVEDYLNAGLPLVAKDKLDSHVMSDVNFFQMLNEKKSKGSSDYRKGGMVLSSTDNRKRK
jgi:hypothetical protein